MSKKVLKLAGRQPMLLALIVMATFTLALLFSGWLTPTPGKAQPNQSNPQPNQENCAASTNVVGGTCPSVVTNGLVSPTSEIVCYGNGPTMPTTIVAPVYGTNNQFTLEITHTNCNTTTNTENVTYAVTGVFWTNITAAPYTNFPTNVTCSFTADADVFVTSSDTNLCSSPGLINLATVAWKPEQVMSLTPSAGMLPPNSTSIWLVQSGCSPTITVTAGDNLGLSPSDLPSCWTVTNLTGTATEIDPMHFSIDGNTAVASTITIKCGSSSQTIEVIVYEAKVELDADKGNLVFFDVGHSWWNLTIQPAEMYQFLTDTDGNPIDIGELGIGGYYGNHTKKCITGCPGQVKFGLQPNGSGTNAPPHVASGTYWWCASFGGFLSALQHVDWLANVDPPTTYTLFSHNCTREAETVGELADAPIGYTGILPLRLSNWLNSQLPQQPCSCSGN
jgi:hypothetical protein